MKLKFCRMDIKLYIKHLSILTYANQGDALIWCKYLQGKKPDLNLWDSVHLMHRHNAMAIHAQCTEVHFVSFLSGRFTSMAVINPPENKLANCISVQCTGVGSTLHAEMVI